MRVNDEPNIIVWLVKRYQNNMDNGLKKRQNVNWKITAPWWPKYIKCRRPNKGKWGTHKKCLIILRAFFKWHSFQMAAQQSSPVPFPPNPSQPEAASIGTVTTSGKYITDPSGASPETPLTRMSWVQNTPLNRVVGSHSTEQYSQGQTPSALGDNASPSSQSLYNLPLPTDVSNGSASSNHHGTRPWYVLALRKIQMGNQRFRLLHFIFFVSDQS